MQKRLAPFCLARAAASSTVSIGISFSASTPVS